MTKFPRAVVILALIIISGLVSQILTINNEAVFAHRDGCHRWHSCPSDTGSYVCGDLGYDDECPSNNGEEEEEEEAEEQSESKSNSEEESESKSDESGSPKNNPNEALLAPTISEGIEISGPITYVVDGDTLDVNNIRIRLALVNTPEVGQTGFYPAKNFVENLCLEKNGEVNIDEGQRQGSFGREIGVVYCNGVNVNQALMSNNLAVIDSEFCDVSEFASDSWAKSSCSPNASKEDSNLDTPDTNTVARDSTPKILSDSKNYQLVTKWGSLGKGHGQFNHPASIETDQNGQRLYIADVDNNRVQVVDGDGHFITEWGILGKGDGEFNGPGSIAVDDSHKMVFVADIKNNRIQTFDTEGNYIKQWGTLGKGDGEFDHPGDIALDTVEETLYVTDIYNNRIQKFYYDGNYITQWGTFGNGEGEFNRPAGITIDPEDNIIYVSDTVNNRIQVFDGNGNFTTKWGSIGSSNGQFNRPDGILFEPSENSIYVADRKNHRIQVFNSQGTFIDKWEVSDSQSENVIKPRDIALDSSAQAYVVDKDHNNILIYEVGGSASLSTDAIVEVQEANQENNVSPTLSDSIISPTRHGKSYFAETFESNPDDPVYVVSHSTKRDRLLGDLYYDLVGEIKNRGEEDVTYVEIIVTFYDNNDIVIGTDSTYTDPSDLRPGQKAPYDLSISDSDVDVEKIAKATYSLQWD